MTALNLLSPHNAAPPSRTGPAPARTAEASEAPGGDFGATLAQASRQAREPQGAQPLRPRPREDAKAAGARGQAAATDSAPTGPQGRETEETSGADASAHAARRNAGPHATGPQDDAARTDELARLLARVKEAAPAEAASAGEEPGSSTAAEQADPASADEALDGASSVGSLSAGAAQAAPAAPGAAHPQTDPAARAGLRTARETAQGLTRLAADDGAEGAAGRAGRLDRNASAAPALAARSGASAPGGAAGAAEEARQARQGARFDQALGAAASAAEASALSQGSTALAQAAAAAAAPAGAGASASSPSPLAQVTGLPGPGLVGATSGPDGLARSSAPGEPVPHFTLSPSLESPTFAPALGLQLSVLARDGIEQARMQINPQEMGPIGVQLTVVGQQVQVEFVSDQARTRQVLEQSLQQLASALGDAGFTMTGGGVFQHPREGQPGREGANGQDRPGRTDATGQPGPGDPAAESTPGLRPRTQRGLVDLYA